MRHTFIIFQREFLGYFSTSVAYVFLVIFLLLLGVLTFYVGNFLERNQADLQSFFFFHPWIYLILMPAIAMRLWSEELKIGTIEILMTLPITVWSIVLGKFLAAWCFAAIALVLTFPLWITVSYLGNPDHGIILAGYLGSLLIAGSYLAMCACLSATTKYQITAFILGVAVCFTFTVSGFPLVLDAFSTWTPQWFTELIASISFITRFNDTIQGVLHLHDIFFFLSLIVLFLFVNVLVIEMYRTG